MSVDLGTQDMQGTAIGGEIRGNQNNLSRIIGESRQEVQTGEFDHYHL